jgi:hypothetical protein
LQIKIGYSATAHTSRKRGPSVDRDEKKLFIFKFRQAPFCSKFFGHFRLALVAPGLRETDWK